MNTLATAHVTLVPNANRIPRDTYQRLYTGLHQLALCQSDDCYRAASNPLAKNFEQGLGVLEVRVIEKVFLAQAISEHEVRDAVERAEREADDFIEMPVLQPKGITRDKALVPNDKHTASARVVLLLRGGCRHDEREHRKNRHQTNFVGHIAGPSTRGCHEAGDASEQQGERTPDPKSAGIFVPFEKYPNPLGHPARLHAYQRFDVRHPNK